MKRLVLVVFVLLAGCSSGVSTEERNAMLDACRKDTEAFPEFRSACFCAVDYMIEHGNDAEDFDDGDFHRAFRECGFSIP